MASNSSVSCSRRSRSAGCRAAATVLTAPPEAATKGISSAASGNGRPTRTASWCGPCSSGTVTAIPNWSGPGRRRTGTAHPAPGVRRGRHRRRLRPDPPSRPAHPDARLCDCAARRGRRAALARAGGGRRPRPAARRVRGGPRAQPRRPCLGREDRRRVWYPHTLGRGCVQQVLRDTATLVADGLGRADLAVRSAPPVREARGRTVKATDSQPVCSGPAQGSGRGRAGWAPGSALAGQGWAQAPSPAQPSCTV